MSSRDPLYGKTPDPNTTIVDESFSRTEGQTQPHDRDASDMKAKGQQAMDDMSQKGQQAKDTAQQKVGEASDKAQDKADKGMDKAASGLDQAADKLREQGGQQGGTVGSAAAMTADKLESAGGYLREKDTDQLVNDLEALIRRKPMESLLVAAGVGFVLSKLFR